MSPLLSMIFSYIIPNVTGILLKSRELSRYQREGAREGGVGSFPSMQLESVQCGGKWTRPCRVKHRLKENDVKSPKNTLKSAKTERKDDQRTRAASRGRIRAERWAEGRLISAARSVWSQRPRSDMKEFYTRSTLRTAL